jgi:predicted transcriptional regulator
MPDDGAAAARRPAGALEAEILALLRAAGTPLSPGQVRDRLGAGQVPGSALSASALSASALSASALSSGALSSGALSYSTVVTILSRLHAKGLLSRHRDGRAFVYTVVDEASLAASRMSQALEVGRDHDAVLTRFVSGLSGRDTKLLRRLLGPESAGRPDLGHGAADHGAADHGAADHGAADHGAGEHGAGDHGPGRGRA